MIRAAGSFLKRLRWDNLLLPLVGVIGVLILWSITSAAFSSNLPSPTKTWEMSKPYILDPFEKRGELDQGILRFTFYSLVLVAKGYALAILIGTPLGFWLGLGLVCGLLFAAIRGLRSPRSVPR